MLNQGKGQAQYGAPSRGQTHLPPKSPYFASGSAHRDSYSGPNKGHLHSSSPSAGYEKYEKDSEMAPPVEPSWLNELLDSPKVSQRRYSHRRSASDTAAFLEAPNNLNITGGIADMGEFASSSKPSARLRGSWDFDRLDEDQIANMFSQLEVSECHAGKDAYSEGHKVATRTVCRSMHENWIPRSRFVPTNHVASTSVPKNYSLDVFHENIDALRGKQVAGAPEFERARVGESYNEFSSSHVDQLQSNLDCDVDPEQKQNKRLSNRQSAQRSRVRKLQYIAELERRVNELQTEVSNLSPQVAFLDHQRSMLTADNKALKQRLNALLSTEQLKDAHIELMKEERHRLKLLLYQQQGQQVSGSNQVSGVQFQAGLLQSKETKPAVKDFVNFTKASNVLPSMKGMGMTNNWAGRKISAVKTPTPSGCTLDGNGKNAEAAITS